MTDRHRTLTFPLAGAIVLVAALTAAPPAVADPADPAPAPVTTVAAPPPPAPVPGDGASMTPNQPAVAPADAGAPPVAQAPGAPPAPGAPAAPVFRQDVPEIANPTYGSGNGVLGTLKDLWHQAQHPYYSPDEVGGGGAVTPPPGAGPAPALPPGYVSINAPGSETPVSANQGGGPATGRPALPPGYYSTSGPPPPGYEYNSGSGSPAAPTTTAVPAPTP
ncbi:hypothetical protein MANY_13410 [Mycolicibacterium anyangense]|uniref:Uncharacterized protein n=1 Tax=Mycolicibacterium anyangense TaxID=1431246 RepID=A0A6N4W7D4_9MYCO|nr:hypothetical protein [Mycolicibacterium anyangense]BBZ76004.1 hypothetical protein MANY_13410 [Mycolicibacterium anyangense]